MSLKRFPFGLTIASAIAFAILIWLGVWQLQRLAWKQGVIDRREALLAAPPRPLVPALNTAKDVEALDLVRVQIDCPGLAQAPYEMLYGLARGMIVNRLVSACPLEGSVYDAVLVDRGFVLETISSRPAVIEGDTYPVRVVGVLASPAVAMKAPAWTFEVQRLPKGTEPGKKLWMGRDLEGMASALGVKNPAPYFLVAETSSNPDWQALTPGMPPVVISNNHLSYAMTWFGLAGVLGAIYAALLRRKLKG